MRREGWKRERERERRKGLGGERIGESEGWERSKRRAKGTGEGDRAREKGAGQGRGGAVRKGYLPPASSDPMAKVGLITYKVKWCYPFFGFHETRMIQ